MLRFMNTALWLLLSLLVAGVVLWWFMDHRNGVRWAQKVVRDRFPDVPALSPEELAAWLKDPGRTPPLLLDARGPDEQAVSTLPGAHCIDPEASAESALAGVDRTRPLVVYCAAGYRGARMARRLMQAGCKEVFNLDGGIFAWANEGHPVEKDGQALLQVHPHSSLFSRMLKNPAR